MRDIKFRAWDLIDKIMYYNVQDGISFDDDSTYEFTRFLGTQFQTEDDYHEWELMQYTGLKDKNGVEIYEGDYIKLIGDDRLFKVVFHHGSFMCENVEYHSDRKYISQQFMEVIGNIYENPELLDKKPG